MRATWGLRACILFLPCLDGSSCSVLEAVPAGWYSATFKDLTVRPRPIRAFDP